MLRAPVPLPRNNLVKTKYEHKANELTSKRREAEARFGLDLQKRGISEEVAATTEGRAHIESVVRKERDHLDSKSPYYAKLRTYLMDQVDQSVKQAFKLKPFGAPVPKATANFIPVPDKTTYFPVLHSPPTLYSPTRSARSIHSEVDWEKLASSDDSDDDQSVHSAVETVEYVAIVRWISYSRLFLLPSLPGRRLQV